ncbi:MAG: 3-isopropylmalate dehydratase [Anaerolineales bacterium]|nr:3-isopropylmalate dehydratase [Anaerolineales bacterium]
MNHLINGRIWLFGDNISTDHIIPGRFFHLRNDLAALAGHAMEDGDPAFTALAQPGDIIVAGKNFGQGSSREFAALVLKERGIPVVLARSFARIFYRNAVNVGLAPITCDTTGFSAGDVVEIDLPRGWAINKTQGFERPFAPLPAIMLAILSSGGLVTHIKKCGELAFKSGD